MHRIFQEDPRIFTRTFKRLGLPFPDPIAVSLPPTDLTEIKPLERRLDTLLRFDMADGDSYLLAVEAQGRKDPDKHGSWAYYMSYLYAKYRTPPLLLVVCQDEATSRWAKRPFHIGTAQWRTLTVRPLVLGPHNVPIITDASAAADDIPMAAFAAITHGKHRQADIMLEALATALRKADLDTADLFKELTEIGLGSGPAGKIWKDLMAIPTHFFRSETSEKLREEGREEGRRQQKIKDILSLLQIRSVSITEAHRERVAACTEYDILDRWFSRAATAERAEDVFA
ncbi:hypothetical protein ACFO3J_02170 [Streptomyces polygonati]|uniref:Transposase (putative) YhgA-like domain-containing protein n=1 Tax=Streptomyces polygonati TaxID=1617087 RepID=A0ABV8HH96_9ACTN